MKFRIMPMHPNLWPEVRQIYAEGIATGNATFETELPDWQKWDSSHRKDCRLIAVAGADEALSGSVRVFGWAALSSVSTRHVYRGVAEVSVYVAASSQRKGMGKALLEALIQESELNGIWTLQAGIFPENKASVGLHKSCGFREVGIRRKIGALSNTWRDVLLLERRSSKVGL
ncbi:MAG TPA: GNAT family N-acetyltransferase [Candidatus Acidoferrales bacterium]|nr:GNAT family N-acetyltransferase [Candidatus Acidoferrales bacterium]